MTAAPRINGAMRFARNVAMMPEMPMEPRAAIPLAIPCCDCNDGKRGMKNLGHSPWTMQREQHAEAQRGNDLKVTRRLIWSVETARRAQCRKNSRACVVNTAEEFCDAAKAKQSWPTRRERRREYRLSAGEKTESDHKSDHVLGVLERLANRNCVIV